jgi:ribonuclease J
MNLIIHCGTHAIGGSCVEIATDTTRIIIDIGAPLPKKDQPRSQVNSQKSEILFKEKILPQVQGLYDFQEKGIAALFISHAHPDHYGFLPYVHPDIPVYASRGTQIFMELNKRLRGSDCDPSRIQAIRAKQKVSFGDLAVRAWCVDHSAPDALAFEIEGEGKKIFYSGDFRGHGRKSYLFQNLLKDPPRGVNALIMEGTLIKGRKNAQSSEEELEAKLFKSRRAKDGLAFFACSSQNIDRLVSAYKACMRHGGTFVIDPYTAEVLHKVKELSPNIPQFNWGKHIRVFFVPGGMTARLARDKSLFKFKSAKIEYKDIVADKGKMLVKDSYSMREYFAGKNGLAGAVLFYSQWEGYLKAEDFDFMDKHSVKIEKLHASGHAALPDLKRFAKVVNPEVIVPIHTEYPEEFRAHFGSKVRCLLDDETLEL